VTQASGSSVPTTSSARPALDAWSARVVELGDLDMAAVVRTHER
jgi:hypothetical protein